MEGEQETYDNAVEAEASTETEAVGDEAPAEEAPAEEEQPGDASEEAR